jgi:hypothetical protein
MFHLKGCYKKKKIFEIVELIYKLRRIWWSTFASKVIKIV